MEHVVLGIFLTGFFGASLALLIHVLRDDGDGRDVND